MSDGWTYQLTFQGETFELSEGEQIAGRSRACDISVPDASVSRKHARLEPGPGHILVQDLNSSNGTFINDRRVQGEDAAENGDTLRFGDAELRVAIENPAAYQTMRLPTGGVPRSGREPGNGRVADPGPTAGGGPVGRPASPQGTRPRHHHAGRRVSEAGGPGRAGSAGCGVSCCRPGRRVDIRGARRRSLQKSGNSGGAGRSSRYSSPASSGLGSTRGNRKRRRPRRPPWILGSLNLPRRSFPPVPLSRRRSTSRRPRRWRPKGWNFRASRRPHPGRPRQTSLNSKSHRPVAPLPAGPPSAASQPAIPSPAAPPPAAHQMAAPLPEPLSSARS